MKRRAVQVEVTDHAVLRWLERRHGLDVTAVKRMMAGQVRDAAELDALAVVVDGVRFMLRDDDQPPPAGAPRRVMVATVLKRDQRRGLYRQQRAERPDG